MIQKISNWEKMTTEEKQTSFDSLSPEEQELLKERGKQMLQIPFIRLIGSLKEHGCPFCGTKGEFLQQYNGSLSSMISPEFFFHANTTHGYPPEILREIIDTAVDNVTKKEKEGE